MVHNYSNPERTCNMQEDEMVYEDNAEKEDDVERGRCGVGGKSKWSMNNSKNFFVCVNYVNSLSNR